MASSMAPLLSVAPVRGLVDEKFKVRVENLSAGHKVTLRSLHLSEDNDYWEAFGHYISDHNGVVCVSEDLCLGGTYTRIEPMGLMWSLRPIPGSRKGLRLRKMNVSTPLLYTISVYSGHLTDGFRDQTPLASVLTERWYMAPGVQRISINEAPVRGTLFLPPGPGPFPGLLDMWGGGGGLIEYRSAILASHGYVSLVLEYFQPGEWETSDLETKYFENAFNIVKNHPRVIPDKVGIVGLSVGATVAFHLASESKVIKPCCCVCISGQHVLPEGMLINDFNIQRERNIHMARLDEDNNLICKDVKFPGKERDVGKINCPILLVCAEDDQDAPAVDIGDYIERALRAEGKGHLVDRLNYPGAGHLLEVPYTPHFRATAFNANKTKIMLLWGGQTKPHADAQEDSWKKILEYLRHHLYSKPSLKTTL